MLIDKLNQNDSSKIELGLDRIKLVLNSLSNPQNKYKIIHIAGTNGKGSTATFIECALIHARQRVGKFTSPYLIKINEMISLNGHYISDLDIEQIFHKIEIILTKLNVSLTPFEYITTIMFEFFAQQNIDYLVLEVGMGGLNDATNVVNSIYTIITNISLEHTSYLGNTLREIARHKCGIIKSGKVITATTTPELIDEITERTNNYVNVITKYQPQITLNNFSTILSFADKEFILGMFGIFQGYNFLCAYEVLTDLKIDSSSILYSAANAYLAGRMQLIATKPNIILDAMHNEDGAINIVNSLKEIYLPQELIVITSILKDKAIDRILEYLSTITNTIIYTSITNSNRGLNAQQVASYAKNNNQYVVDKPEDALTFAKRLKPKAILITGSLYLISYFLN